MKCLLREGLGWTLVFLLVTAGLAAQGSTAQINGTVVDSSGGVLPGATVIVVQTDTGLRREVVTDEAGSYALTNLPIGPYRLEVTLPGFRTYSQTGIVLQVGSNPVIPVTLQLGELAETVSVEAAAPLVETRSPSVGGVIENERIEELPLNGRNTADLIELAGAAVEHRLRTVERRLVHDRLEVTSCRNAIVRAFNPPDVDRVSHQLPEALWG